jgi:hypothetical protein
MVAGCVENRALAALAKRLEQHLSSTRRQVIAWIERTQNGSFAAEVEAGVGAGGAG